MDYKECNVLCKLKKKKKEPLITKVETNSFTDMVSKNFDYDFTGESKVYPFELPKLPDDFEILCIVGASGSGKSTLLKELDIDYSFNNKEYGGDSNCVKF